MSTDALALSKPLHERIYERIRDSIGDLMSDEDLKILVDKATENLRQQHKPPKVARLANLNSTKPQHIVLECNRVTQAVVARFFLLARIGVAQAGRAAA